MSLKDLIKAKATPACTLAPAVPVQSLD